MNRAFLAISLMILALAVPTLVWAQADAAFDSQSGGSRSGGQNRGVPTTQWDQLESVKAFDEVVGTLLKMRHTLLADAVNEREASEGMRFILRTLTMASDVTGDGYMQSPHFARMDTPRRKIGGDNPDGEYDNLVWDGEVDYKITGNLGSVDHLSFTVLSIQDNGRSKQIGYLNERDLKADWRGNFTIWLSGTKPEGKGDWIKTGKEAGLGTILVRQYFGNRKKEKPASFKVEVVGQKRYDPLPPSTDLEVAAGIRNANNAMLGIGFLHHYVTPSLGENENVFKLSNSDDFGADISSPDNLYVIGTYNFEPDEALIIEVDPLDVRFWNLAIENPWHESVDYAKRRTSRTGESVKVDPDGKVRFLLAHARTDHPNYLETAGHQRGFMTFRYVGERDTKPPLPTVMRLPLDEALAKAKSLGGR